MWNYRKTTDTKDALVIYDSEDYVTVTDKEISITANGEKELTLKVHAPSEMFEGILVEGLTFKEKVVDSTKE